MQTDKLRLLLDDFGVHCRAQVPMPADLAIRIVEALLRAEVNSRAADQAIRDAALKESGFAGNIFTDCLGPEEKEQLQHRER